jgi:hypothetical protein
MAKYDLKFIDAKDDNASIRCKMRKNLKTKVEYISISASTRGCTENTNIWLDKSTAIKFAKTLRTEINKIKD